MTEPAKDEAELVERVAKAFCCPSPSGCVDNINCDRLDFQIDAIRSLAAIRAAGWAVVPVAELDTLRAENTRLRVALEDLLDDTLVEDFGEWFEDRLKQAHAALEAKP
jgi:hypothetical protein